MFQRIDSGRVALGAAVIVAVAAIGVPVAADEPTTTPPVETGEVDGATVAVGAPPVPPTTTVPVETGEVDGATVAVGAPPVPPTTVAVETGEVDGATVAVGAPPVPAATPGKPVVRSAGGVAEQPVIGRLRAAIVEQQIATALADATADAVRSLRVGR